MAETLDHRGVPASSDGSLRDHPNIFDMFPSNFPEGLRVLVFDEDPSYLLILETHLQEFQCKVTACNEEKKAMYLLRNHTNMFDIAMIQVNNSDGDRFRFLSKIGSEMDIPIIIISEDDSHQSVIKWMSNGASDYLIKPIRPEELPIIFIKHMVKKLLGRRSVVTGEAEEKAAGEKSSSVGDSTVRNPNKRKRSICHGAEVNEEDHHDHDHDPACASSSKKRRVVWSGELHQKFLEAVKYLGIGKAVPKKILEIMNVEGITRENVASHLQKHRIGLQKQKENDKIKREETNLSLILPQEGTMYVGEDPSNIYRGIRNVQCPTHHHTNNIPQPLYVPQQHTTNPNNLRTHLIPPLGHQLDGVSIANLMMNHQYQNHLQTPDFTTQENYAYNNNFNEDEPIATNFYFTAPNLEDLTLHLQDLAHEAAPSPRFPLSSISPSYTHSSNLDQRESGGFSSNSSFM